MGVNAVGAAVATGAGLGLALGTSKVAFLAALGPSAFLLWRNSRSG